jgi:hypothetical protein
VKTNGGKQERREGGMFISYFFIESAIFAHEYVPKPPKPAKPLK